MSFQQRRKTMPKISIAFFNKLSIEKKKYTQNLSLIMDSKRRILWNKYMSREKCQPWLLGDLC
jgi:hypothetical protein